MCEAGATVFAVVKDCSTFGLKVISATVFCVEEGTIVLHRPASALVTDVYRFPESEWKRSIFESQEEAETALKNRKG